MKYALMGALLALCACSTSKEMKIDDGKRFVCPVDQPCYELTPGGKVIG